MSASKSKSLKDSPSGEEALDLLWAEVAESVAQATPLAMAAEGAIDVECTSERSVRELLLAQVKKHRQRSLQAAWAEYQRAAFKLQNSPVILPPDPLDRRKLLVDFFARSPQLKNPFLTVQHRESMDLSDNDVESFLRQLHGLGVLDIEQERKKLSES